MFINYYKRYELDRNLDVDDIKKTLENMCTDLIRRLNNAGGNAEREYELRKELETLEQALEVFSTNESKQVYDQQLKENRKEGMLTNEELDEIEMLEDLQSQDVRDQERLESLLEKIATRQIEAIQEKEKELRTNINTQNNSVSNMDLNNDKSNSLVRLAQMGIGSELDGYVYVGRNNKIESYIEEALRLDSTNYLAWQTRFFYLLRLSGDKFRFPWDFTTLNSKELEKFTKDEREIIHREGEMGNITTRHIESALIEWDEISVLEKKNVKAKVKSKFSKKNLLTQEELVEAKIEQIKLCKDSTKLIGIVDKAYEVYKQRQYTYKEKCKMLLKSEQDYRELEECYRYAIELAPAEKKKGLEKSMNQQIDYIYTYLLDNAYEIKKEFINYYIIQRYKYITDEEKNIKNSFKKIKKKISYVQNRTIDTTCYILLSAMMLLMLSYFFDYEHNIYSIFVTPAISWVLNSLIIKLRGGYKYREIIMIITSSPFFISIGLIILRYPDYLENLYNLYYNEKGHNVLSLVVAIVLVAVFIYGLSKKSFYIALEKFPFGICMTVLTVVTLVGGWFLKIFWKDIGEAWIYVSGGTFVLVTLLLPKVIASFLANRYSGKYVEGLRLDLSAHMRSYMRSAAEPLFSNSILFKIQ